ncbi:MAG TPA: hypothetical protein EYP47_04425 [Methanococcaceae archaeon]|nr:hypothetical protein [Methanococcaceae archaeon]
MDEALGKDWSKILPCAIAIETIHNFTLIHDVTVARALKSRRGNVHLHGVIALVKNGEVSICLYLCHVCNWKGMGADKKLYSIS